MSRSPRPRTTPRRWFGATAAAALAGLVLAGLVPAAVPVAAQTPGGAEGGGETTGPVSGVVVDSGGAPVPLVGVAVIADGDLVDGPGGGQRVLASTVTDAAGRFSLGIDRPGCHRVRLTGPTGSVFSGGDGRVVELPACVEPTAPAVEVTATLQVASTHLAGRLIDESGAAVAGGGVTVRAALGDGTGGSPVVTLATGPEGWFDVVLPPGCYVADLEPPPGRWFVEGRRSLSRTGCLDGVDAAYLGDSVVEGSGGGGTAPSPVEWELVRLTNELRADPAGPLARPGPEPACIDDPYFAIELDPATGHPLPVPPLTADLAVADTLARPWAGQLGADGELRHRPSDEQEALYHGLGLDVGLWGENVAWARDYPVTELARAHFTGWRDSDEGHYCSLVTDRFTHVGVGEVTVDGTSWAVQNFYRSQ